MPGLFPLRMLCEIYICIDQVLKEGMVPLPIENTVEPT